MDERDIDCQGQDLALTVLYVPYVLNGGLCGGLATTNRDYGTLDKVQ